jgi:hypothetical protein
MNDAITEFETDVAAKPPETYYDIERKEFLTQNAQGVWYGRTEAQYKRELLARGISPQKIPLSLISPLDEALLRIQHEQGVDFVGPLAGYHEGFHDFSPLRCLVTTSPSLVTPLAGEFPVLLDFLHGLLGDPDGRQLVQLMGWLKVAIESLSTGNHRPGQALVLVGPAGCGKSLLQKLITVLLGGRCAKPYQVMTKGTSFNKDLFGAEHLMIEDEQPSHDIRARRAFGTSIKDLTVNTDQRFHPKHRDAMILRPFWRLSVSLNDEPENLQVLPPMDESIEDKIIILKAVSNPMPMPTRTSAERKAFWDQLIQELPAFLRFLELMEIPEELTSERFGLTHYHHPDVVEALALLSPEADLLDLIDSAFFGPGVLSDSTREPDGSVRISAKYLEEYLTAFQGSSGREARRLLEYRGRCATYLGRLAKSAPDRVEQVRTSSERLWLLRPPEGWAPATPAARAVA